MKATAAAGSGGELYEAIKTKERKRAGQVRDIYLKCAIHPGGATLNTEYSFITSRYSRWVSQALPCQKGRVRSCLCTMITMTRTLITKNVGRS